MKTGEIIKILRIKNNMTQKDLADKLNVSVSAISQFEKKENLQLDTLKKIAAAFDVHVNEFLKNDNETFNTNYNLGVIFNELNTATKTDFDIIKLLLKLNDNGKEKVLDYTETLTKIDEYKK